MPGPSCRCDRPSCPRVRVAPSCACLANPTGHGYVGTPQVDRRDMITALGDQLQAILGSAYHIERELGGGSMSRLFVATERSLGRLVVIKVLSPDVAGDVSAARFQREIAVTANLPHPPILPILPAGAHGDLLYYLMPYVEGESLRDRLARDDPPR